MPLCGHGARDEQDGAEMRRAIGQRVQQSAAAGAAPAAGRTPSPPSAPPRRRRRRRCSCTGPKRRTIGAENANKYHLGRLRRSPTACRPMRQTGPAPASAARRRCRRSRARRACTRSPPGTAGTGASRSSRTGNDERHPARDRATGAGLRSAGCGSRCAAATVSAAANAISQMPKPPPSASMSTPPAKFAAMKVIEPHSRMRP